MSSRYRGVGTAALAAILALSFLTSAAATAQDNVAVIDVTRIMTESARGKAVVAELEQLQASKTAEIQNRQQDIADLRNRIQEGRLSLSEDTLATMQSELETKAVDLERATQDAERELQRVRQTDIKKVEDDVFPIIQAVGKEKGLILIFNKFQSGLVYADDAIDITDEILQRFDATPVE